MNPDENILDLDVIVPVVKHIKINGKIIECHTPKIKQLIRMTQMWRKFSLAKDDVELEKMFIDALSPIVPAVKEDDELDFSFEQLKGLVEFVQKTAVPTEATQTGKEFTTEKKTPLAEASPTSSTTTPPTQ